MLMISRKKKWKTPVFVAIISNQVRIIFRLNLPQNVQHVIKCFSFFIWQAVQQNFMTSQILTGRLHKTWATTNYKYLSILLLWHDTQQSWRASKKEKARGGKRNIATFQKVCTWKGWSWRASSISTTWVDFAGVVKVKSFMFFFQLFYLEFI